MKSRAIKRSDCELKMDKRKEIVADKFQEIAQKEPMGTPAHNYFSPTKPGVPRNAFLFEREHILNMFFPKDMVTVLESLDMMKKAPTHLLAILGAHHQDDGTFKEGQATVIVMGVKSKNGRPEDVLKEAVNVPLGSLEDSYPSRTANDEEVGYEYPPSTGIPDPPPSGNPINKTSTDPLTFKFLP